MFEGYKVTAAEKRAIESAWSELANFVRSDYELNKWAKLEQKGYGIRGDSVPLIAAKALILNWFLQGTQRPDALLRNNFNIRPAAIWATGLGAREMHEKQVTHVQIAAFEAAKQAHDAAFDRMHHANMEAIKVIA